MAQPVTLAADAADVLIVGAGPAGATASLFLGDKGIPHTVVDRLQFPRDKVDGNVFGSKVLAVTAALSDQTLTQAILQSPHLHHCWHGAHIFGDRGAGTRVLRSNRATVAQAGSTAPLVTAPLMMAESICPGFSCAAPRSRLAQRIDALLSDDLSGLSRVSLGSFAAIALSLTPLLVIPFHH